MEDRIIRFIPMPTSVKGLTTKDCNDDYNIYINANISASEQETALKHENRHIDKGDFFSGDSVRNKELSV